MLILELESRKERKNRNLFRKDDYITNTHRGHGHCIAKGGDLNRMMAEFLGKTREVRRQ